MGTVLRLSGRRGETGCGEAVSASRCGRDRELECSLSETRRGRKPKAASGGIVALGADCAAKRLILTLPVLPIPEWDELRVRHVARPVQGHAVSHILGKLVPFFGELHAYTPVYAELAFQPIGKGEALPVLLDRIRENLEVASTPG